MWNRLEAHREAQVAAATFSVAGILLLYLTSPYGSDLATSIVVLATESVIFTIVYRLILHPLAEYPGPWYAAATDWYNVVFCLSGERHLEFYRIHQKYGPAVRFGPNRVSFCTEQSLQDIYGTRANTQRSKVYSAFTHYFGAAASLTTLDRKTHAIKRRINGRAVTPSSVKALEELILRNVRAFCTLLSDSKASESSTGWSEPQNMSSLALCLLSDIMGDVTFSKNWSLQASTKNRPILDILSQGTQGINTAGHMPQLIRLKLDALAFPSLLRGVQEFFTLSKAQVAWRMEQNPETLPCRDLFAQLIDARDPDTGTGYSQEDLVAEAGILIVAGTDTTAEVVTSTLFYLLHHPTMLDRARAEVDAVFPASDGVEAIRIGPRLSGCEFLYACVYESLRISPPVGGLLAREVLPGGLLVEGKWHLPAGTDVGVAAYALHHHERYWPQPHAYRPERWLGKGEGEGSSNGKTTAWAPFGFGRTSCIGKHLAYQEIGIVLARMLWLLDIKIQEDTHAGEGGRWWNGAWESPGREREGEFQLRDVFTSTHEGPMIQVRRRDR